MINRYMGTQVFRKGLLGALLLVSTFGFQAFGTTYTVTTTSAANIGAGLTGSLSYCIGQALNDGADPHLIQFSLPGASPYIIPVNAAFNMYGRRINIDGTSQAGWGTNQTPLIVLQGGGGNNAFDLNGSTVTVKGFIFQSFSNGFNINNAQSNQLFQNLWFGLTTAGGYSNLVGLTGTAILYSNGGAISNNIIGGTISSTGVRNVFGNIRGSAVSVPNSGLTGTGNIIQNNYIGINSDGSSPIGLGNNSNAVVYGSIYIRNSSNILVSQNVIGSVSGTAINFDGTSNSTITSNFIGTNPTGNIAIPNGGTYPLVQHGIYLNNNNTNLLINNNLISNNLGYGIFADGSGSNHRIQGNIIGLNQTGLQPFSNKVGGIYYHATSTFSNITIGGIGSGLRNIISANGVTTAGFVDQQNANSNVALQFDATNACGIYLYSVVNSVLINNYIGTDINGNSTTFLNNNDLGNLYAGIKIENNSASNLILNNIVGGNGFRSSYYSGSPQSIRGYAVGVGHGILIKDNGTVNNQFRGNYIGLGANGLSPIGNRQDGFSIQGAKNNTIGGLNISDRNYSANNAWGIFIQSDFWRSQSSGNVIINNYLGTDVTGLVSVGNGTRSFDGDGGGIGVQHASYNNVIGIAQVNGGNVISGNRTGIHIKRNNPLTGNTTDNACAPGREPECRFNNSNNSISNNIIGLNASGNGTLPNNNFGIYLQGGNDESGRSLIGSITGIVIGGSSPLSKNTISGNLSNGIRIDSSYNNIISNNNIGTFSNGSGNAGNGSDGIQLTNASRGNIIGGSAAEANTIGFNTGNGIQIVGPGTSRAFNNGFYRNTFTCNGARAIALNGGNQGYAAPTVSGSSTTFTLTGPASSYIQLFRLDNCNTCGTRSSGASLVAEGPSPLTYSPTGTLTSTNFTALASSLIGGGISSTTGSSVGNNTSEFTFCLSPCTTPSALFTVTTSSAICSTSNTASLTISNAQPTVVYTPVLNGTTLSGSAITATTTGFVLNIPSLTIGSNFIRVLASNVCTTVASALVTVTVNSAPNVSVAPTGSIICPPTQTSGTVTFNAQPHVTYNAFVTPTLVGGPVTSSTTGSLSLTISTTNLALGANNVIVTASIAGCPTASFAGTNVFLNPVVNLANTSFTGGTICNPANGSITVATIQSLVTYYPVIGTTTLAGVTSSPISIPTANLSNGSNLIRFIASTAGCGYQTFARTATIVSNVNTTSGILLTGSTTCGAVASATVSISGAIVGNTYTAFTGLGSVSQVAASSSFALSISTTILSLGNNSVLVTSSVASCGTATVGSVNIRFNPTINSGLSTGGNTICIPSAGTVTIAGSQSLVTYTPVINGTTLSGIATVGNGGTISFSIPSGNLVTGQNLVTLLASTQGCPAQALTNVATITGNTNNIGSITFASAPNCSAVSSIPLTVSGVTIGNTYTAYVGVSSVSQVAASTSIILNISTTNLSLGNNAVQVTASVAGCGTSTVGSTNIWLNPVVNLASTSFAGNTVCDPNSGSVTVTSIQPLVTYYPILGTSTLTGVTSSPISISNLIPGANIISFLASINGCSFQNFSQQATIVSNVNTISGNALTGSTTCGPATTATVSINGTIIGNTYAAYLGSTFLSSQIANGSSTQLTINTSSLSIGDNSITVTSSVAGCGTLTVGSVNILINPEITNPTGLTGPSLVCNGSTATLTLTGAVSGVTYYPVINSVNGTPVVASSSTVLLTTGTLSTGTTTVFVGASVSICPAITFSGTLFNIVVRPVPNTSLIITGGNVCQGSSAIVTVSGSELGVDYTSTTNGNNDPTVFAGNGGDLFLTIQNSNLNLGANIVSVSGTGCLTGVLSDTAKVYVNSGTLITTISGSNSITQCFGTTGTFSAATLLGATYTWSVPSGSTINSGQGTSSIDVTFGTTSGFVSVIPNSALCGAGSSVNQIEINIINIPVLTSGITGPTDLCPNDLRTFSITGIANTTANWSIAGLAGSSILSGLGTNIIDLKVGNTSGTLSVFAQGTCGPSTVTSLAITVNSFPSAFTITSTGTQFCQNAPEYSIGATNSTGNETYQWSFSPSGSATASDNTAKPTITFGSTPGDITISVQASNACGPTTTTGFLATISSAPGLSQGIVVPNIDLCANNFNSPSGYVFTIPTIAGSSVTYNWTVNQGTFTQANPSDPFITVTLPSGVSGNVTANVTVLGLGCGSPSTTTSVAITGLPDISTQTISGLGSICLNTSNSYSIASVAGVSQYVWSLSTNSTPTTTSTSYAFTSTIAGTSTLSVYPIGVCGNGSTSIPKTITTYTAPSGSVLGGNSPICYSTTEFTTFSVQAGINDYQPVTYNWGSLSSSTGSSISIANSLVPSVVTVSATNLCSTEPVTLSTTSLIVVDLFPTLTTGGISGSGLVCNSAINKEFTVTGLNGLASSYQWSISTTVSFVGQPSTVTSFPFASATTALNFTSSFATVSVTAINGNGCKSRLMTKEIFVAGTISGIIGNQTPCINNRNVEYSLLATLPGIASYEWQVIYGTNTITSTTSNGFTISNFTTPGTGSIKVSPIADEVCSVGSFPISITINDTLGNNQEIFGPNVLCQNGTVDYTTTISGTSYFDWSYPSDAMVIASSLGGNFIRIKFGTTTGYVIAKPQSSCPTNKLFSDSVQVQVLSYPIAHAGGSLLNPTDLIKEYPIKYDQNEIILNGTASSQTSTGNTFPQYTYTWTAQPVAEFTSPNSMTPSLIPTERETKVYVLVSNGYCSSIDSALVKLDIDYIPKAFSPNEDGSNDTWQIDNLYTYKNFKMTVYNKWGSPVKEFSSYDRNPKQMWDGTSNGVALPSAVYYYVIDFNGENGKQPRKGSVTIVR